MAHRATPTSMVVIAGIGINIRRHAQDVHEPSQAEHARLSVTCWSRQPMHPVQGT
jgi:hypothetical protein